MSKTEREICGCLVPQGEGPSSYLIALIPGYTES